MFFSLNGLFLAVQMGDLCAQSPFTYFLSFILIFVPQLVVLGVIRVHSLAMHAFKTVKSGVNVVNSSINSKGDVVLDGSVSACQLAICDFKSLQKAKYI